jgi:hypothetical protein
MNNYFYNKTQVTLNQDFLTLLQSFSDKFGSHEEGIDNLGWYIGYSYLVDKEDVRGYEGVPFEMVLPFATGSDGEHMGWIDLCPNIKSFKKPFVVWAPMGGYVFYIGTEIEEIVRNLVRYYHEEENYSEIDLEFLESLNINPKEREPDQLFVNSEGELKDYPVELPDGYIFIQTLDGTGVINTPDKFNKDVITDNIDEPNKLFEEAERFLQTYPATSLVILKNIYYSIWHAGNENNLFKPTLELLKTVYEKLNMLNQAELVDSELKKLIT